MWLTVAIGDLCSVRRARRPGVDVGGGNEERVLEGTSGVCDFLDISEGDAGRVALATSGCDDALITQRGLCGEGYRGSLDIYEEKNWINSSLQKS